MVSELNLIDTIETCTTMHEASKKLKVSERTVWRWLKHYKLEIIKSSTLRVVYADADELYDEMIDNEMSLN